MQTEVNPEWLTYEEAQRLTSLGRTTLWRICISGAVETVRIGRAVRINRKSLDRFMKSQATQPKLPGFEDALAEQPLAKPVRNWFSVLVPPLAVVLDSAPSAVPVSGPLGIDVQDSHNGPHPDGYLCCLSAHDRASDGGNLSRRGTRNASQEEPCFTLRAHQAVGRGQYAHSARNLAHRGQERQTAVRRLDGP
jgi:excisionase family DNA binding protein